MTRYLSLVLFFIVSDCAAVIAQERKAFYDSLAISFLHKVYPQEIIGFRNDSINGIKKTVHNFYAYPSFHMTVGDSLTVELVNFGVYYSEEGWYIAIVDSNKNGRTYLYLGRKTIEDDLELLRNYFEAKRGILKREYKLEILELYLRCVNGQIQTPVYIH
jgi:hypothetical protein